MNVPRPAALLAACTLLALPAVPLRARDIRPAPATNPSAHLHAAAQDSMDAPDQDAQPTGRWRDASLDDYRRHLQALTTLTAACAQARNLKACDPTLIGPDDRIPLDSEPGVPRSGLAERRMIRYGWLRVLFSRAEEPDKARKAPDTKPVPAGLVTVRPVPPTTSRLLDDAQVRLAGDLAQSDAPAQPVPSHAAEHAALQQVLAGREFRNLKRPDTGDTYLERFNQWLNRIFRNFDKLRAQSAWVGRALIWGFILAVGVTLAWVLLRFERRWRVRLVPLGDEPAPGAASARDWQLWLDDARRAASAGLWRDAIHCVYWAAISRLESRRLWPADRARTPREYLALVAGDDPRQPGLASLTGSFERTWYGGRPAAESDYRRAEDLAQSLISGASAHPRGQAPAQGGAQ